jgi:DNA-binding beta-propeller fold protein YncE
MSMRAVVASVCGLVILAGCGSAARSGSTPATDYRLYEAAQTQNSQLIAVIGARSQSTERRLPLGTVSPDGKHLYAPTSTSLQDIDPQTGSVMHILDLGGGWQLPPATAGGVPGGLSQNGQWLVLESLDWNHSGPLTSSMLVVDTSYAKAANTIVLDGRFRFDAISNDGQRMYLIEYVTDQDYKVRVYDVGGGFLDPNVVVDKFDPTESMAGVRLSGVPSSDGQWLYSVYVRENKGAFVHALSLEGSVSFCIDLPGSGYSSNLQEFGWSLALSPDGSHLYAVNGQMGVVADIRTDSNSVVRTAHITANEPTASHLIQDVQAKEFGPNGAVASADGRTLVMAGSTGVVWVDTATLKVRSRQLTSWTVWSLASSPDGKMVYALSDAGKIAELWLNDAGLAATFDPAAGYPMALIRVESVA